MLGSIQRLGWRLDAFVEMLVMSELRFGRAQAAKTGRPLQRH
jgi:hypothetical protein